MTHTITHYADDTLVVGTIEEEVRDGKWTVFSAYTEHGGFRGTVHTLREARVILEDDYNRRAREGGIAE